jgi:hypothetical protein
MAYDKKEELLEQIASSEHSIELALTEMLKIVQIETKLSLGKLLWKIIEMAGIIVTILSGYAIIERKGKVIMEVIGAWIR